MLSDLQGAIKPDKDNLGGLSRIAWVIKNVKEKAREEGIPVLALNMGDNVVYEEDPSTFEKFRGIPEFQGLSLCSIDISIPGNHDFYLGAKGLDEALSSVSFDSICANFIRETSSSLSQKLLPYKVIQLGEIRVGFFGLLIKAYDSKPYADERYFDIARRIVRLLREEEGCSLVIVMSHLGYLWDRELAKNVGDIDVICGGHTHITLRYPKVIRGVPILHAGAYGHHVGDLRIFLNHRGEMEDYDWSLINITSSIPSDPQVREFLDPYWNEYPGDNSASEPPKTKGSGGCSVGGGASCLLWGGALLFPFLIR